MKRMLSHLSAITIAAIAPFLLLVAVPAKAADSSSVTSPASDRQMAIVISESINRAGATSPYERIARVFPEVFARRHWPFTYTTERMAGGTPDYPLELRVSYQGITKDLPGELHWRAWVTLTADHHDHEFGMIHVVYHVMPSRTMDDMLDELTRQAADAVAKKVEAVLFPNGVGAKE